MPVDTEMFNILWNAAESNLPAVNPDLMNWNKDHAGQPFVKEIKKEQH